MYVLLNDMTFLVSGISSRPLPDYTLNKVPYYIYNIYGEDECHFSFSQSVLRTFSRPKALNVGSYVHYVK